MYSWIMFISQSSGVPLGTPVRQLIYHFQTEMNIPQITWWITMKFNVSQQKINPADIVYPPMFPLAPPVAAKFVSFPLSSACCFLPTKY